MFQKKKKSLFLCLFIDCGFYEAPASALFLSLPGVSVSGIQSCLKFINEKNGSVSSPFRQTPWMVFFNFHPSQGWFTCK